MGMATTLKHYAISLITALAPPQGSPDGGNLGTAVNTLKDFGAKFGLDSSIQRQLAGIEQEINAKLVDLGPFEARQRMKILSPQALERTECSIHDAGPSEAQKQRSGALVFVKYFSNTGSGGLYDDDRIHLEPQVEFVGFGADMTSAWQAARLLPRLSAPAKGFLEKEKSYLLWYQYRFGKIEHGIIPYPLYLSVVQAD